MAIPTSAVIHIQNTAPGPPKKIAVATPAILPVPMVAASAVIKALNGVISPLPSATRPCQSMAIATVISRKVRNRSPIVR